MFDTRHFGGRRSIFQSLSRDVVAERAWVGKLFTATVRLRDQGSPATKSSRTALLGRRRHATVLLGVEHEAFDQESSDNHDRGEQARCCGQPGGRFDLGMDGRRIDDESCEGYTDNPPMIASSFTEPSL